MLRSKLPATQTTIFTIMSSLAAEHQAINLGQGFPDFNPDAALLEAVSQAMANGHNQYPHMAGIPALRQVVSDKVHALQGRRYDPNTEITITSGATEALMSAIQCAAGGGDEVIVIEPCYDSYVPAIRLAGATPVPVTMTAPDAQTPWFRIDWNKIEDAITDRTRLLVINTPSNPTTSMLNQSDLDALRDLLARHPELYIVSDEPYEHIVFDGAEHLSLARDPAIAERTFVISSFGKTFHTTGWKVGYCCAPTALTTELRKVHQFMVFTVSSPMQYGYAQFLSNAQPYLQLPAFYQRKRDLLADGLAKTRFKPLPAKGTFFLLADYSEISDLPELEFARQMTVEFGVTVIPVSAFYSDPNAANSNNRLVRFCFAKKDETLIQALQRLQNV